MGQYNLVSTTMIANSLHPSFFRMKGRFRRQPDQALLRLFLTGVALLSSPLAATEPNRFQSTISVGETRLEKRGAAKFTYWLFHVYDGALYLPPAAAAEAALEAVPKRLEFVYHRRLNATDIVKAGNKILERNTTSEERASIRESLAAINAAYQSVAPGDCYILSYHPASGSTLTLNGVPLATLPGEDFARIYFRIWFGAAPVDTDFRDALLGLP